MLKSIYLILVLVSLSNPISGQPNSSTKLQNPPNCVLVAPNFYCDRFEITNFNWLEYLNWTRKVFGANSEQYAQALPDTSVWLKLENPNSFLVDNYLRRPYFRDFPVVGISQKQAEDFAKWRTDRVLELILIRAKIMKAGVGDKPENYFTIERYFKKELEYVSNHNGSVWYPNFRLPTAQERQLLVAHNMIQIKSSKKHHDFRLKEHHDAIIESDTSKMSPTTNVSSGWHKKLHLIYQLHGNVAEWLSESNTVAGGSWSDKNFDPKNDKTFTANNPSALIGFRCVVEYKQWEF